MQERYLPEEVFKEPNATVRHFAPEKGQRDRFGNRLFVSRNLAYLDGVGKEVKAGILISPEGQKFITQNLGILKETLIMVWHYLKSVKIILLR